MIREYYCLCETRLGQLVEIDQQPAFAVALPVALFELDGYGEDEDDPVLRPRYAGRSAQPYHRGGSSLVVECRGCGEWQLLKDPRLPSPDALRFL